MSTKTRRDHVASYSPKKAVGSRKLAVPIRGLFYSDEGSGLVDVSMCLPVFFLLVFGFIDFSLAMMGICNANYAAKAAVRYACIHSGTSYSPATALNLQSIVKPLVPAYPQNSNSLAVTYSNGNIVGSTVNVTISISYRMAIPGMTIAAIPVSVQASGVIVQ